MQCVRFVHGHEYYRYPTSKKAIISSIQFGDSNFTVKKGVATLLRFKGKLETDAMPSIEANNCEEFSTLPVNEEGKVRS